MFRNQGLVLCALSLLITSHLLAQETGSVVIFVTDPSGASVVGAQVLVSEDLQGTQHAAADLENGSYALKGIEPGLYRLEVAKAGFDTYVIEKLRVHGRDSQSLTVPLRISSSGKQTVTVTSEVEGISSDPSTGNAVDGKYMADLPVNDRSFASLLELAPGISVTADEPGGGLHASGLRSTVNYYMIDGVSANTGVGVAGAGIGPFGGQSGANGTNVATNASGSSANLISLDGIKEMRVQVSTFAPEFGRSPGAQISITSRGGTNDLHASALGIVRNTNLNANDWFGNQYGLARGTQELYDEGATAGGAIQKDVTFYFGSFETAHLEQPQTELNVVPDNAARARARAALKPYLNAFPIQNGPELGNSSAEFNTTYSTPSTWSSESIRVDRVLSPRMTTFLRYSRSPSDASTRGGLISTANGVTKSTSDTQSLTGALTWTNTDDQIHNVRMNLTRTVFRSNSNIDTFGGAQLIPDSSIFPQNTTSAAGTFALNVNGLGGYSVGRESDTAQNQLNVIYDESGTAGSITAKIGFDYRLLIPTYRVKPFTESVSFNGIAGTTDSLLSGTAQNALVAANVTTRYPIYHNFGAYYQHSWKQTKYTTVTYGLRWDLNPAPGVLSGPHVLGVDSSYNLSSSQPVYSTRWFNIAPRFGMASELMHRPRHELVFRGGVGVFYDTGYGNSASVFNSAPYTNSVNTTEPVFPLSSTVNTVPVLPPVQPYGVVSGADPSLKSPLIYEFNATIEQNLGAGRVISIGFIGSHGGNLLTQTTHPGFFTTEYQILQLTTNGGISDYRAIQAHYQQTLSRRFLAQGSYTFGHSIDSSSSDTSFGGFAIIRGNEKGDSNYDVRHTATGTATFSVPSPPSGLLRSVAGNWYIDGIYTFRTSLPFDVEGQAINAGTGCTSGNALCQRGFAAQVRPNLTGQPIWIPAPGVPGGRRLNPAAFSIPTSGQGNETRNELRGFNLSNFNLTVRKQIKVTDRINMQLRVDAFNALNHPNFANPSAQEGANLASSDFGVTTRMLYNSFGNGSVQNTGAPRSFQLSLRFQY